MKTRRQHAAEAALTNSRRSTRPPPTSTGNSEMFPNDVIIEILLRLPAKSIAKCRCVCKFWASILSRSAFTELFMTRSRARSQLLLSCQETGEFFFFSIPQVQNADLVAANYHMRFPCEFSSKIIGPVRGLLCLTHPRKYKKTAPVMCNPSTGQSFPLPNVKTRSLLVNSFLGFDPNHKQFKLLSMTTSNYESWGEYQVLTLGTKNKVSWRMIECSISHHFLHKMDGICINGVIYYVAAIKATPTVIGIVCFDVRSEKFRVVNRAEDMSLWSGSTLVNYKGKLGALLSEGFAVVTGETERFELWLLVDAEKHVWSKFISVSLPPLWKNVVAQAALYFVGVTDTDDILLAPRYVSYHDTFCYYVYYYNIKSSTIRRVEIQGMDAFKHCRIHISLNHVEDVQLLQYV